MIVNTKVNHDYIKLDQINFDFSEYGVYIISGKNGTGKSTIMKQLVFEENQIRFNTEEHKTTYENSRSSLISYIEQDPASYHCSVKEYISKLLPFDKKDTVDYYMKKFNMADIRYSRNVESLSGGELMKLNLIGAIIKNTPYIMLDEPTNNLDNPSVRDFLHMISELATSHSIIIISHDPRLNFENCTKILIEEEIMLQESHNGAINTAVPELIKYPAAKVCKNFLKSPFVILTFVVMLILMIFYSYVTNILYGTFISDEHLIDKGQNVIVTYKVDQEFSELNSNYANSQKLKISNAKKYQMIYFNDIADIADTKGIKKIILSDDKYIDELSEQFYNSDLINEFNIFSVPNDIIKNYGGQLLLPIDIRNLISGRLPYDGENEVVVSNDFLKKYYGIEDENPIGQFIKIQDENYEIVGIGCYDLCIVSFDETKDYGFFLYEKGKSETYFEEIKKYLVRKDFYIDNGLYNLIIYTDKLIEKKVLNQLVSNYPAENYISYEFQSAYKKYINRKGNMIILAFDMIYSIISSIFILYVFYKIIQINKSKINAFDSYYCQQRKTLKLYKNCLFFSYMACFLLASTISIIVYKDTIVYLLVNVVVFTLAWLGWRKKCIF
ncbi:ATP-binding cassette domain-containing protein [Anaeromicropila populeti]|uniref:ABC transporter n=1 Tax=Anaeromicropila populeti TaxID=37658 RepID=A0A1I6JS76_9FIRM|nr:ATP-binding cassette domain-containing protein [Anaeromicropila populeti]SFR81793.1 ABC transporter [Anaeromicropila populeti]